MLEATGLMVFYENMLALNNVSIRCEENRIIGVFGANSAGKSTLMYTLSGIMEDIKKKEEMAGGERITVSGKIQFKGIDITKLKPSERARRGLILCPERRRIFKESSVLENLKIGGYLATPAQSRETMDYVFKLFPALVKLKKRVGGFLSGGEQQMLAIGRALMAQPALLLLDEPQSAHASDPDPRHEGHRSRETDFYPCDRTVRAARAPHCGLRLHSGKRGSGHGGDAAGAVE